MCAVLVVCTALLAAPAAASAQAVRLGASPSATTKRQALTLAVRAARAARCRLEVRAGGRTVAFPALKADAKGRAAVRWQLPRHAPRGVWRFAATCAKGTRRAVRRSHSRVAIKGSRGTGGLVARSSTVVLRGHFPATGVRGGSSSCAPLRDGKPVCFASDPFFREAGQATWYANGRRPDLTGVVRGPAARWLAQARGRLPVGTRPVVGAIAVWAPGADGSDPVRGHVAYVSAVTPDGKSVSVDEANWVPGVVTLGRKVAVSRISGYIYGGAAGGGVGGAGGVPVPGDADGDGIPDASDPCPTLPAVAGCPPGAEFLSGDVNMDDRDDLVVVTPRGGGRPSGANYGVFTSTGSALSYAGVWGGADSVDLPRSKFEVGDLNNDSREDLLVVTPKRDAAPSGATFSVLLSNGTRLGAAGTWGAPDDVDVAGSEFLLGDATNDGRDDLFVVSPRPGGVIYSVWTSNGTTLSNAGVWFSSDGVDAAASRFLVGDVNLDGRDDVVAVTPRRAGAPSGANYNVLLSGASALTSAGLWSFSETVDIPSSHFDIGDANSDERADVLVVTPKRPGVTFSVLTSSGTALTGGGAWGTSDSIDIARARFMSADVTGDARKDLLVAAARRDTRPTGAGYSVLPSSGSAFGASSSWGSSDDADVP
jgi:surface antigen